MRILHITPHYHPAVGGAETYTKEISERLARRGHDVTVLSMTSSLGLESHQKPVAAVHELNGVKVATFNPPGRFRDLVAGFSSVRGVQKCLGLVMGEDRIRMLSENPYGLRALQLSVRSNLDIVGVINWFGGALPYQVCVARRFARFALVGTPLFHTEREWVRAPMYREMLERCDAVVALTDHEKRFIEQRSGQRNAQVVGVGVEPSLFAHADGTQTRARLGIGAAPLVGYVGRMVPGKGVVTLIEAMTTVWQTDSKVRLLLAGSGLPGDSSCHDEVARAFARLSAAERSRIVTINRFDTGEKSSIFDALDLFAMPSLAESFGIAYLEAWICKKAVIGSRIGSTQYVIEDGVDGVLVTPHNPDDLAASILQLLQDYSRRDRMGRMGYSKTMTHFTWDKITDKIERIYQQTNLRAT